MSRIRFDEVHLWTYEKALPFWADRGLDRAGLGFVEHLDLQGNDARAPFKRMRVQARQVYVFSHAALTGFAPGLEVARRGVDFILRHGRTSDGVWARRLGRDGGVLDPTPDFYDQAFVLFALAWWARASGDDSAIDLADRSLEGLDRVLGRSDGRGYHAERPDGSEAVQNPHMHLLEALLALYETTGAARFKERAIGVTRLFQEAFYDSATGSLAEYYDQEWRRAAGDRGRIVEPGHQFEWSWLLHHATRLTGEDLRSEARGLFRFAEANGLESDTGLTWDEVLDDGTVNKRSYRSWPQTEALKAHLARFEFDGELNEARLAQIVDNLLDRYLAVEPIGAWIDHFAADGSTISDKVPASTLYHVFLAFSELLRLRPALEARLGAG